MCSLPVNSASPAGGWAAGRHEGSSGATRAACAGAGSQGFSCGQRAGKPDAHNMTDRRLHCARIITPSPAVVLGAMACHPLPHSVRSAPMGASVQEGPWLAEQAGKLACQAAPPVQGEAPHRVICRRQLAAAVGAPRPVLVHVADCCTGRGREACPLGPGWVALPACYLPHARCAGCLHSSSSRAECAGASGASGGRRHTHPPPAGVQQQGRAAFLHAEQYACPLISPEVCFPGRGGRHLLGWQTAAGTRMLSTQGPAVRESLVRSGCGSPARGAACKRRWHLQAHLLWCSRSLLSP